MDTTRGGKALIIVGGTGMGKSTLVRRMLTLVSASCLHIYDVNQEYTDLYPYPLLTFKKFNETSLSLQDSVMLYEEATIFFSNKGSDATLREVLVRKRHNRNTILLVFHSLRSVPKYLLDLCNMIVLLKTNDPIEIVERFDHQPLLEAFNRIREAPMCENENGHKFSPSEIVKLLH